MSKKNNIRARVQNFYKRWNIEYNEEERIKDFKNRILGTIDTVIRPIFVRNPSLLTKYFKLIGIYVSLNGPSRNSIRSIFLREFAHKIKNATLEEAISYLQRLFYLDVDQDIKDKLYEDIKEDIELSLMDIQIKKTKGSHYILYPAGAKLLDEGVVNDVLGWLSDYPKVYNSFNSALEKHEKHEYARNLIDDLRLSLELLLKKILNNNKKGLEKQIQPLGRFLKDKDISAEIRNLFSTLVKHYTLYQNEHAKHNDSVNESEIEFMIYLTGTFMRFILNLEANPAKDRSYKSIQIKGGDA